MLIEGHMFATVYNFLAAINLWMVIALFAIILVWMWTNNQLNKHKDK